MMKPVVQSNPCRTTQQRPSAARRAVLVLLSLATWAAAETGRLSPGHPDPAIITLPGTNAPIPRPTPALSDIEIRLRRIDLLSRRAPQTPAATNPVPGITALLPSRSTADISTELRMQRLRVKEALKEANTLFRDGSREQAFEKLRHLLERITEPELREQLLSAMGVMRFKQQNYAAAAKYFEEARHCAPHDVRIACNLAAAYMSNDQLEMARELLSGISLSLVENAHLAAAIQINLACINSMLGRTDDALEHLSQAAQLNAAFTGAHLGDTQLDAIRNEKRFETIARQINFSLQDNERLGETDASRTPAP